MLAKLIGIVKLNLSGAKRRENTWSGERGAGKGAAALCPASAPRVTERDKRSDPKLAPAILCATLAVSEILGRLEREVSSRDCNVIPFERRCH
jgi:hypothetical protein